MTGLAREAAWWALVWALKAYWVALCFYVPWQHFAAVEDRIRRAYRRRKESVNR